jgi:cytoskeletal protein CcmA (bactofilin family)
MTRPEPPPATLAANAEFEGIVQLRGPARIEGRVRGELVASGLLWIGAEGRIAARIEADQVIVAGEVEGEVRASERIELLPSARVRALLEAPRVVLAEGCFFEGECRAGAVEAEVAQVPLRAAGSP